MSATPQAKAAVRAVKNRKVWGDQTAYRYAEKRGVSFDMYLVALGFQVGRETRKALQS